METVSAERFGGRDAGGLLAFLRYCRGRAEAENRARVGSISLRVRDLDPLAVLRAIQEPGEPHLYWERSPVAVSGAESVALFEATGPGRFAGGSGFVEDWTERIVATGDLDGWFAGPLFFHAFSFADANEPACTVFLPKWQVCRSESECVAVANVRVEPGMELEPEAGRILRAHARFSAMDFGVGGEPSPTEPPVPTAEEPDLFLARVRRVLESIAAGSLSKIVVSRWMDLVAAADYRPLEVLRELRETYPDCFSFSYSRGAGASWIGATPERLVRQRGDRFETEAIAGSAPRGKDLATDTALGKELLSGDKDLREHALVVRAIEEALRGVGREPEVARYPHLLRLSNVQHLRTPVAGKREPGVPLLRMAEALHPTPAVGGVPRDAAPGVIAGLEPFSRGLYSGFLGWEKPGGDGDLVVALRTARVEANRARLFAGAGIVEGSDPDRELRETEIKLRAMSRALAACRT